MDKLNHYRNLIKTILGQFVEWDKRQPTPGEETVLIADDERNHYVLMTVGWVNNQRVLNMRVYVRLHDEKFWIEEDWTEDGIAADLLREGVPKEDIVLAFHDPETRKHTDFAAA
ncbi:MAG: XisI protein [Acidobacteriota bacterium]